MLSYRTSGIALALLSLFACTTVYQKPHITNDSGIAWQERQSQLSQLTKWQISGRASITQDKKAWNAGINWLENTGTYRIKMMGPFLPEPLINLGTSKSLISMRGKKDS